MFHTSCLATLLLLQGCAAKIESGPARLPALVTRRVTAAVEREALRLVHLQTEHESFTATPEHPFAMPGSGWIGAEQLAPGDWVVSERLGAVRLLSVRSEPAAWPVPVFNLSVAASHAYFVGRDRVLVHNTTCKPSTAEAREEDIEEVIRERDGLSREIRALTRSAPTSPQVAKLKLQRKRLQNQIDGFRRAQRTKQGVTAPSLSERAQSRSEADRSAIQKELEEAQNELAVLESQLPTSAAEKATVAARKAELEKQIGELSRSYDRTNRILTLLRRLAELEQETPATDADRQALEERKSSLRDTLARERNRAKASKHLRSRRSDPDFQKERTEYQRKLKQRLFRSPTYLADAERPRDILELLEEELASRLQEAPSESRDARIHHLTEHIDTIKGLNALRREIQKLTLLRHKAQRRREKRLAKGRDTTRLDQKLEQTVLELRAHKLQRTQLRVRQRLLKQLDGTPWAHAPGSVDEARLREFQRLLVEGLEDEQQLADIEQALGAMDPSEDPALEPTAGLQSNYAQLEHQLREERTAVEVALSALANEHASIQTTQTGSSEGPTWQERLSANQEEQRRVVDQWRAGLQARVTSAQSQLQVLRSIERFRDEAVEAELTREINLLERELKQSGP